MVCLITAEFSRVAFWALSFLAVCSPGRRRCKLLASSFQLECSDKIGILHSYVTTSIHPWYLQYSLSHRVLYDLEKSSAPEGGETEKNLEPSDWSRNPLTALRRSVYLGFPMVSGHYAPCFLYLLSFSRVSLFGLAVRR